MLTRHLVHRIAAMGLAQAFTPIVHAHEAGQLSPQNAWNQWSLEPGVVTCLFLAGALYASGLHFLRLKTDQPKKLRSEARYYTAGWLVLALALVSPIHPWGQQLFSAHMTQHELLMVAAAPLLILGRPLLVILSAFPRSNVRRVSSSLRAGGAWFLWRWLTHPFVAWSLHAVALWLWHVPALFQSTLDSEWSHAAQHASFLGTALLFWEAVFYGPRRGMGYGLAVLYLFTTALHSGALGALLTFTSHVWYPRYAETAPAWGLSAIEDQELGGLIMWIPAGFAYLIAALALFAGWLRTSGERSTKTLRSGAQRVVGVQPPKPVSALAEIETTRAEG